jgi:hypothetical protein
MAQIIQLSANRASAMPAGECCGGAREPSELVYFKSAVMLDTEIDRLLCELSTGALSHGTNRA